MTCTFSGIRNSYYNCTKRFTVSLQENFGLNFYGNCVTSQFHTINIIIIFHPPLYNITKVGRKKSVTRNRFEKAAELRLKDPVFKVSEAMLAEKHLVAESQNRGKNFELIIQHQIEANKPVSINPSLIGLLVFGGKEPETKHTEYRNSFEIAFIKENSLEAWTKVGAALLTRYFLASHKVCHEGVVVVNPFEKYIQ